MLGSQSSTPERDALASARRAMLSAFWLMAQPQSIRRSKKQARMVHLYLIE